jgi:predicted alpha/beta-hydrolase family hydrolase
VLTFNYPYMEGGKRRPDHQPKLLECHRAALYWLATETGTDRVVLAGRSMGGRMGTYLAAERHDVAGVILYAYPLHPTGKPDRLRVEHLTEVAAPMLFFAGTRDSMARADLIEEHLRPLPGSTVELIDDADHSFRVPKRSGRTFDDVLDQVADRTVEWMQTVIA